jgi:PmbA protein
MPTAVDPSLGVEVARDAVDRAVRAGADAAKAHHRSSERFEVNFDTNDVTLVRTTVSDTISLTVLDDTRKGSVEITGRAHDAVDRAVGQALEAAAAGQRDPANVLPEGEAEPASSDGHSEPDREAMVDAVLRHITRAKTDYPQLLTDSSNYHFTCTWSSYANSNGRTQHARRGRYTVQLTVTGRSEVKATSFNYTVQVSDAPMDSITDTPAIERLILDTLASFDARPVPATFVGDVIFTPLALSTLVGAVAYALSGLTLMRNTSPYADALGTAIAAPAFNLLHRPSELAAADAFDAEGFPNTDLDVIRDGVLENFLIDWYTAHKLDRPMTTGSADLLVAPGDTALDDVIANTERGILLGRYSGGVPNPNLDFSGVAKNSFYIEDGKVQYPIAETMVAGNFQSALQSVKAVSSETIDFGSARFPWLAVDGITISTK